MDRQPAVPANMTMIYIKSDQKYSAYLEIQRHSLCWLAFSFISVFDVDFVGIYLCISQVRDFRAHHNLTYSSAQLCSSRSSHHGNLRRKVISWTLSIICRRICWGDCAEKQFGDAGKRNVDGKALQSQPNGAVPSYSLSNARRSPFVAPRHPLTTTP